MPNDNSSPQPIDIHRVQSLLLSFGGSFFGARQFLAGQIVTDPADRQAFAQMVVELSNHSRGNGIARDEKHNPLGSRGYNPGAGWKDHGGRNAGWKDHGGRSAGWKDK